MIKTIKVMLKPNNKQQTRFFQFAGASRFAYNWALARQQENYKNGGKFIHHFELQKEFTQLKKQTDYSWLKSMSNKVSEKSIQDACGAYENFFKGRAKLPKFKSKKKSKPSFYRSVTGIEITATHIKLEKISPNQKKNRKILNWVRLAEKNKIPFGEGVKYYNPRITFDGLNWFISIGVESEIDYSPSKTEGIGIDLGLKDLAITSDGDVYKNINKTKEIKRLEKKKRRLQRKVSRKHELNKVGNKFKKTNNILKTEKEILRVTKRLTNIRHNYLHHITSKIVKRKPSFIVLEDLNVTGMMKNKHLSKTIQEQCFYEFRRQIEYKTKGNNIEFILADRWFPSSKTCSLCGEVKKDLKLSDRIYRCECGNKIDRDYQAAVNLKRYGERVLKSI